MVVATSARASAPLRCGYDPFGEAKCGMNCSELRKGIPWNCAVIAKRCRGLVPDDNVRQC